MKEQKYDIQVDEAVTYVRSDVPAIPVDTVEPSRSIEITRDGVHGVLVGRTPLYFVIKSGRLVHVTTSAKIIVNEPRTITDEQLHVIILALRREASEYGYLEEFAKALNHFFIG